MVDGSHVFLSVRIQYIHMINAHNTLLLERSDLIGLPLPLIPVFHNSLKTMITPYCGWTIHTLQEEVIIVFQLLGHTWKHVLHCKFPH